jgi:sulfatase maturation enzyme AslB (radical SAM superfamily)
MACHAVGTSSILVKTANNGIGIIMSEYVPDRWIIVEIANEDTPAFCKVLAGWLGGYARADEWRLSSPVVKVDEHDDYYEVHNESGSIYKCSKHSIGTTNLSGGVLNTMLEQNSESVKIAIIDIGKLL